MLVLLARNPRSDVAALARECGLEAAEIDAILRDLEQTGYIHREHAGSSTCLVIDRHRPLRHPVERHHPVGRLLDAVESPADVLLDRLGVKD